MFTKKGEATLTVLIIGVLAVSLISAFSNSYTGYQIAEGDDEEAEPAEPRGAGKCIDYDKKNIYIPSNVTYKTEGKKDKIYFDRCVKGKIKEYFCSNGQVKSFTKNCPKGYKCSFTPTIGAYCKRS